MTIDELIAKVRDHLDGIDRTHDDTRGGFWQTDDGAKVGKIILRSLELMLCAHWPLPAAPSNERPWERPGWCNEEGQCWMGDPGGDGFVPSWRLCRPDDCSFSWSLPHGAIPIAPVTPPAP